MTSPVKTFSDMVFAEIVLTSGARYQVKPEHHEPAVYVVAGEVEIIGRPGSFRETELILLEPGAEIVLEAPAFDSSRLMLMGGELFRTRHVYWSTGTSCPPRPIGLSTQRPINVNAVSRSAGGGEFAALPDDMDQGANRLAWSVLAACALPAAARRYRRWPRRAI